MAVLKSFISFVFSLRGAIVALLFALLLIQPLPAAWQVIDRILIKIAAQLTLPRTSLVDTALVELSPAQWRRLQSDPAQATAVMALLASLQHSSTAVTALVLDSLPRSDWHVSEQLLVAEAPDSEPARAFLQQRKQALVQLKHESVALLVPHDSPGVNIESALVPLGKTAEPDWYGLLPAAIQAVPETMPVNKQYRIAEDGGWPLLAAQHSLAYPLLVQVGGQVQASAALRLLQRSLGASAMQWLGHRQLHLGEEIIATSVDGKLLPFYSAYSGVTAPLKPLSLQQALDSVPEKSIVLIGLEGDPRVQELANTLVSLQQGAYWYSPYWSYAGEKILLVLLALFLLCVFPLLNKGVAVLTSLLAVLVMLAAQLGWMVTQWQWLPLGMAIQFLMLGTVLMSAWSSRQRKWRELELECHQSNFQLAQHWYQQDQLKLSLDAIAKCRTTEQVLDLAYDVAAQQERKRQYEAAADTYQVIVSRKRGFKDAARRAKALASLKMGNSQEFSAIDAAQTLVLPDANVNRPVLGRYEIERELGRGAMGVVYLGHDPKISRRVAIKTLNYKQFESSQVNSVKERFFREAEAAGRLHHPNIVTVYDVGEEPDLAFIAMDFVDGSSLSDFMTAESLLPVDAVYELLAQVAEALAYAHQQNIVHRDIKPGNIMYNPDTGQVKVADFGIARIIDDSKTKTGDILGSPIYMSPEQLKGSKVTGATDIYSLGVTMYQLLTAEVPFNGDSIANLAYQILNKKFKSIREVRSDLPASAARIVNKAMQKDPAKRYADGIAMAEALRKSLGRDF